MRSKTVIVKNKGKLTVEHTNWLPDNIAEIIMHGEKKNFYGNPADQSYGYLSVRLSPKKLKRFGQACIKMAEEMKRKNNE